MATTYSSLMCKLHSDQGEVDPTFVAERLAEANAQRQAFGTRMYQSGIAEGLRQAEAAAARAQQDERFSLTRNGRQIVVVANRYAYLAPEGQPLAPGDEVLTPANWFRNHAEWERVTGIGSSYDGDIKPALAARRMASAR